jgi:hypothetical protein
MSDKNIWLFRHLNCNFSGRPNRAKEDKWTVRIRAIETTSVEIVREIKAPTIKVASALRGTATTTRTKVIKAVREAEARDKVIRAIEIRSASGVLEVGRRMSGSPAESQSEFL